MARMTKTKWSLLIQFALVLIALVVSLNAETIVDLARQGVVIRNNNIDLGHITAGTPIEHRFEIWNTSLYTVEIAYVRPQCTCSVAEIRPRKITPFKRSIITLKVNTTTSHYGITHRGALVVLSDGRNLSPLVITYTADPPKK